LKRTSIGYVFLAVTAAAISWTVLGSETTRAQTSPRPVGTPIQIKAPLGLPPVPVPADNPPTKETIALGRRLYYDPVLSVDKSVSCATCHGPAGGFTDNKAVSTGVNGKTGSRSAPTVINSAYSTLQFWDGRAATLEAQAAGPMANPVEMAHTLEGEVKALQADSAYREEFKKAWGTDQITIDMVTKSIASFERTVLSGDSPFDRYYYGGDKKAMSPSAIRGLKVFTDAKKGNCAVCHTIEKQYALFTDNKFHNIGVGAEPSGQFDDVGRVAISKDTAETGAFKTPTLRNIEQTAPYMHDGSLKSLKEVVDHYIGGGNSNPYLDKQIHALDFLSGQERQDLENFLRALTGPMPADVGPPAGLPGTRVAASK
jgi:cytochrome c peroxidase